MTPLRRVSDDALAELVRAGDDRAFAELFERHGTALYRYCRSIVHHDQDAQDAVQTTMAQALAALRREPLAAPLRPWLFRIAHNESISVLRRRKPVDDLDRQRDLAGAALDGQVEDRARLASLVADLQELPERQRAALVMRELSGLSHEEIAVALAIPVSATKQAIFDARRGLQAAEAGRHMECEPVQRAISDGDGRVLRARNMRAHVRGCRSCRAMRDAIDVREKDLASLTPALPGLGGAALLERIFEATAHGGGSVAGGAGAGAAATTATVAATAGKTAGVASVALSGKALGVTAAIVTAVGTAAVVGGPAPAPRSVAAVDAGRPQVAQVAPAANRPLTPGGTYVSSPAPSTATGTRGVGGFGRGTAGPASTVALGGGAAAQPVAGGAPGAATVGTLGTPGAAPATPAPAAGSAAPTTVAPGATTPSATPPASGSSGSGSSTGGGSHGGGSDGHGSGHGGSGGGGWPGHGSGGHGSGGSSGSGGGHGHGGAASTPKGPVQQTVDHVVDTGTKATGAAKQTVDHVVDAGTQTAGAAVAAAGQTVGAVTDTGKQAAQTAVTTATQTVDAVGDTGKQVVGGLVKTGTGLLSQLKPKHSRP